MTVDQCRHQWFELPADLGAHVVAHLGEQASAARILFGFHTLLKCGPTLIGIEDGAITHAALLSANFGTLIQARQAAPPIIMTATTRSAP